MLPVDTRTTTEELFGSELVPTNARGGAITCQLRSPTPFSVPTAARCSGTAAASAQLRTRASSFSGSSSGPVSISATARWRSTPGNPST